MAARKQTSRRQEKHQDIFRLRSKKVFAVVFLLLIVGSGVGYYLIRYNTTYLPRTEVNGILISGLTFAEASAVLEHTENDFLHRDISLSGKDKTFQVTASQMGATFSRQTTLDALWQLQHTSGVLHRLRQLVISPFLPTRVTETLTLFSGDSLVNFTETTLKEVQENYREVGLKLTPGKVEIIEGEAGEKVNLQALEADAQKLFIGGGNKIDLVFEDFSPQLTADSAVNARDRANSLTKSPWTIQLGSVKSEAISTHEMSELIGVKVSDDRTPPELLLSANTKKIETIVAKWAAQVDQKPVNARLGLSGDTVNVISEGQVGRILNQAEMVKQLANLIESEELQNNHSMTISLEEVPPEVSGASLSSLGISQRIGLNTTDFSGSPTNRKANITLGSRLLNSHLVKPGETFSTLHTLGPITTEAGFLNELVIKGTRTIPEAGGGLCQVSTTLFRAVLNAGLPIVERQNHSYRVGYYEREVGPGLDATIYEPNPDFRWKNDMSTAILVQSQVVGNTITFELYGKTDGRVSQIGKPVIVSESPPGDAVYVNTDTLFVGQQQQIEKPKSGAVTTVSYKVTRDGKEIYSTNFRSVYKNWPAQYLVGTKPLPAGTPSPTPTPAT